MAARRFREAIAARSGIGPRWLLVMMLAVLATSPVHGAVEVGAVVFAKGAVSARDEAGAVRLLARESPVHQGDTVATADESFAVLRFSDDTKMSIRPNSEVVIDRYSESQGEEAVEFSLIKGGLRAITGAIGSQRPESVRFNTRAASIGIRGTDLALRLCEADECRLEELSLVNLEPVRTECLVPVVDEPPGLFFIVLDGGIYSERGDQRIELDAIGAGYANEQELTCMSVVPRFVLHDEYLNRIELNLDEFELFDVLGIGPDDYPACEVL